MPPVEVRSSQRRKKYATAFWQGDRIVVLLPARLPRTERQAMVDQLVGRVLRHRPNVAASDAELASRAAELGDRYLGGVRAASVRWSPQQRRRWGSCSLETREIRISELLRPAPPWVVDAVLVHELAHLVEHGHGREFRALVGRFERTSDADVFLAGYALGLEQAPHARREPDPGVEPVAACEPTHAADTVRVPAPGSPRPDGTRRQRRGVGPWRRNGARGNDSEAVPLF